MLPAREKLCEAALASYPGAESSDTHLKHVAWGFLGGWVLKKAVWLCASSFPM